MRRVSRSESEAEEAVESVLADAKPGDLHMSKALKSFRMRCV